MRTSHVHALASIVLMIGCTGELGSGPSGPRGGGGPSPLPPVQPCDTPGMDPRSDVIRRGLERNCAGCHTTGEYGYFASAVAFESLLVRNPRMIVPGDPDASPFVQLLEGTREGSSLTQMPLSGDPFAVLATRGETDLTMADIRTWITELTLPAATLTPDADAATVQRVSATHLELGLRELLGLTHEDFFTTHVADNGSLRVIVRDPDSFAVRSLDRVARAEGINRYDDLGGGSAVEQRVEDRTPSTTFVQTLVPLSQSWCARAVRKVGNTALFTVATPMTGSDDAENVRAQIRDWHLLFLAEPAIDEDVESVVTQVFTPLESESDAQTAWIGTCAYFIRHPLFVLY